MRLSVFSKCPKFYVDSKSAINYSANCSVFKINAFELVAGNSPYYEKNT